MALMQVQQVAPRSEPVKQEKEKKSAMEMILEGLQIANGVLGIANNVQSIRSSQRTIEDKDYAAKGGLTKEQETDAMAKGMTFSDTPQEGGTQTFIRTPEGDKGVFIKPPGAKAKDAEVVGITVPGPGGKPMTQFVKKEEGAKYDAYREPQKPTEDKTPGNTADLRKEYNQQKTTQNTYQVIEGYKKIQNAFSKENPSPADEMSGLFGFMKMQDPGSTVREGEYASAENTRGIPDAILQAYNKAREGQKLSPEQRANFLAAADGLYDAQLSAQEAIDKRYSDIATKFKVDPNYVLEPSFGSTRQSRAEASKAKGGSRGGPGTALGAPSDAVPGVPLSDIEKELQRRGIKPKGASGKF
jgi:hypothetical protein